MQRSRKVALLVSLRGFRNAVDLAPGEQRQRLGPGERGPPRRQPHPRDRGRSRYRRSAVVQLVSTGEALMERRIAEIPASEWDDLSVNLTPRETIIEFLAHAFSMAGGTGRSYHADLSCTNTERRIHYLLEPGWRADRPSRASGAPTGRTRPRRRCSAPSPSM